MSILLSRQPVLDDRGAVVGYAFRYGSGDRAVAPDLVFLNALLSSAFEQLRRQRPAFLYVDAALIQRTRTLLQPERSVLVVRSRGTADEVAICQERRSAGHRLVLDACDGAGAADLLDVVDTVRLDVSRFDDAALAAHAAGLRDRGLRLLAAGARSRAAFERCRELGFTLFEGCDIGRPDDHVQREPNAQYARIQRALQFARDLDVPERAVVEELQHDAALAYRLLRVINVAGIGVADVRSIPHAVQLLGRKRLFHWLALLLIAPVHVAGLEDEIMRAAVMRARFCELLAVDSSCSDAAGSAYLVGLLSAIGPFVGMRMEDCAAQLRLAPEPARALTSGAGPLGELLSAVLAFESGDFTSATRAVATLHVAPDALTTCYVDAVNFAWRIPLALAV